MRIRIPALLKQNEARIAEVRLEASGKGISISEKLDSRALNSEYILLHDEVYKSVELIRYKVVFEDGSTEHISFRSKEEAADRSGEDLEALRCIKKNTSSAYHNNKAGINLCLEHLENFIASALTCDTNPQGTKNLIYYSVYFNSGYVDLLCLSLESIFKHTKPNFDVLIITDEETKKIIELKDIVELVNPKFYITETPEDGVKASQNKLRVFEYEKISDYAKILFLDADIVATESISSIFKEDIDAERIYSIVGGDGDASLFRSLYHGFKELPLGFVHTAEKQRQVPFNAGQFLIVNSSRMVAHFENILWLMDNWPADYFFEQSFMCYYFAKLAMIDVSLLERYILITDSDKEVLLEKPLVHFTRPPLEAKEKCRKIKKYLGNRRIG